MMSKFISSFLLYFSILALTIWIIGFVAFCFYALSFKFQSAEHTDAIVVLTGGGDRIHTAFDLLSEHYAEDLLISGVHPSVKISDLTTTFPADLMPHVTLGYSAQDTRGNAREMARWIHRKKINSVLLITSFYHMPRSVFEVLKLNPNIDIIPLPVFPKSFNDSVDWIRTRYAWLLFIEYHKFIATRLQSLFERSI